MRWIAAIGLPLSGLVAGTWSVGTPLPERIQEHHGVLYRGQIYVAGGIDSTSETTKAAYRLDLRRNVWERIADLPEPRHHMPLVVLKTVIAFAGWSVLALDLLPSEGERGQIVAGLGEFLVQVGDDADDFTAQDVEPQMPVGSGQHLAGERRHWRLGDPVATAGVGEAEMHPDPAFAVFGERLINDGGVLIDARADRVDDDLTALFARKPMLATGMVFRLFGFDRRDRDPWVGTFAYGPRLSALISATEGVTDATMFGDALAAVVAAHHAELSATGASELHERAARRNAERQASWAEVDEEYRRKGSWRGRAPTKGQRYMMQRIEAARSLPMPVAARRGASADAITGAGGNPRFGTGGGEQA